MSSKVERGARGRGHPKRAQGLYFVVPDPLLSNDDAWTLPAVDGDQLDGCRVIDQVHAMHGRSSISGGMSQQTQPWRGNSA
jgi:hypothetical protein